MSKGIMISAVCAVAMFVASVSEAGQPSASKMRQMGLYGVPVVSDAVAMEVRGFGYRGGRGGSSAEVWGRSSASVEYERRGVEAEASASNGYSAEGDHFAAGVTVSAAAILVPSHGGGYSNSSSNGGTHLKPVVVAVAGGFSAAYAR